MFCLPAGKSGDRMYHLHFFREIPLDTVFSSSYWLYSLYGMGQTGLMKQKNILQNLLGVLLTENYFN